MSDELKQKEVMLSTSDNPFNPFSQFKEWYAFDISHGYNTLGYLAAVAETDPSQFDRENNLEWYKAIYDAKDINLTGNRIIVEKETDSKDDDD